MIWQVDQANGDFAVIVVARRHWRFGRWLTEEDDVDKALMVALLISVIGTGGG